MPRFPLTFGSIDTRVGAEGRVVYSNFRVGGTFCPRFDIWSAVPPNRHRQLRIGVVSPKRQGNWPPEPGVAEEMYGPDWKRSVRQPHVEEHEYAAVLINHSVRLPSDALFPSRMTGRGSGESPEIGHLGAGPSLGSIDVSLVKNPICAQGRDHRLQNGSRWCAARASGSGVDHMKLPGTLRTTGGACSMRGSLGTRSHIL